MARRVKCEFCPKKHNEGSPGLRRCLVASFKEATKDMPSDEKKLSHCIERLRHLARCFRRDDPIKATRIESAILLLEAAL
jgi:hypothetical protein